jgi:branched-chain amino acid transport system substrate-binding protein
VLLATGDAYWGLCSKTGNAFHPIPGVCATPQRWTMGWQPDYPGEARNYAKYVLSHQPAGGAKIGILYQNDAYGQNYLAGFVKGLGSHTNQIVDEEKYNFGDSAQVVGGHIGALKAHQANVVLLFSTPTATIQSLATMGGVFHWTPLTLINNVSANRVFMLAAEQNGATPNGVISSTYIKSQTATPGDRAMTLAKRIIQASGNSDLKAAFKAGDNNLVYGLAVAWTFVDALKHAGSNPTRASFMHAIRNLNESQKGKNPFVFPGMYVRTSAKQTFPMNQLQLEKWSGSKHDWKTVGSVFTSGY